LTVAILSKRSAPYLFALLLSGFMTFIVSGIATFVAVGPIPAFLALWGRSWITAWAIAFPALIVIRPLVHRIVERLTD
jgi:Protein of unknown function (DUF2798)